MDIALIAAVAENGVLGLDNDLPWHLPRDLRYFKQTTLGKPVIMGRKTWDSIDRRPLPGRVNVVISSQPDLPHEGALLASDFEAALAAVRAAADGDPGEIMVVGGSGIYAMALPQATRLYLTEVHMSPPGDTWFPEWDRSQWREVSRQRHAAEPGESCDFSFVVYER